jgi:hypothetical protein
VDNKVTPGEIVVMAAGALGLISAFLPFYKNGESVTTFDEGLFPVATLIALFVVAAAVLVALVKFANMNLSAGVLGFGFLQLLLALGFFAAILAIAFLIAEKGGADFGFGYFLLLIAGVGSVVGAVLMRNERPA